MRRRQSKAEETVAPESAAEAEPSVSDGCEDAQHKDARQPIGSWDGRRGGVARLSLDVVMLLWEKALSLMEEDMDESAVTVGGEESDDADLLLSDIVTSVNIYILATCVAFSLLSCIAYIVILLTGLMDATASTKFGVVN